MDTFVLGVIGLGLVVVNQQLVLRQLKKLGYQADSVANGGEALDAVRRAPYDIILMDCQMPELDGYEATRIIRKIEQEQNLDSTPIIAMTANAMEGDEQKCLDCGMSDYLSKPIVFQPLNDKIMHWSHQSTSA